jgi:hypothetical protein
MMSVFLCGVAGGALGAYFAWPYGWFAAAAAYAFGGAFCALAPALVEWRLEVLRERAETNTPRRRALPHENPHPS